MLLAMSLQNAEAVRVKEEPEWEDEMSVQSHVQREVKVEAEAGTPEKEPKREEAGLAGYADREAEEQERESASGVSEAAARAGLYRGHSVKEEIVVEPEEFHRPKLACQEPTEEENQNEQLRTNTMNKTSIIPGEKAYKCAHCSYTSTFKIYLQQHQLSHTKEKLGAVEEGPIKEEDRLASYLDCEVKLKGKPWNYAGAVTVRSGRGRAVKERWPTAEEGPKREEVGHTVNSDCKAEEQEWESTSGVSKAAAQAGLYRGHEVKEEIVVGPEEFHRPRSHTKEKPNKCAHCSYASAYKSHLQQHQRTHTKEKPYKCAHCSFAAASSYTLKCHVSKHTGEKQYKCADCSYATAHMSHLKLHKRSHTQEKPYKCGHCSYATAYSRSLKAHAMTHTGEKPYKCAYCTFATAHSSALKYHVSKHTSEKQYKCAHCSFGSAIKSNLIQHLRCHAKEKPYKCSHCSYASAYKSNLQQHQGSHTKEKPYKCAHCSYASAYKSNLQQHQGSHNKEKPYKCAHCSYASAYKGNLQKHQRSHTKKKPYKCVQQFGERHRGVTSKIEVRKLTVKR